MTPEEHKSPRSTVFDGERKPIGTWRPPKYTVAGECLCGALLPQMSLWERPGMDWSNTVCPTCGRYFVDEEDYISIYDKKDEEE